MGSVGRTKSGISVCIPARNSAWCLPDCLNSLEKQSIKPDEIVICIGPSQDDTEKIVKNFQSKSKIPVKIVYDKEGLGTGYARKTLVENSKQADTILWIDSDCIAPPNWIEMHLTAIQKYDYHVISGPQTVVPEEVVQTLKEKNGDLDTRRCKTQKTFRVLPTNIISNGNCSMRKNVILTAGNYDPLFSRGQDWDITIRLRAVNAKMAWSDEIECLHRAQTSRYARSLKDGTFLKFLYKYGLKYVSYNPLHFGMFSIRVMFLFSCFLFVLSIIYFPLFWPSFWLLLVSASLLVYSIYKKSGRLTTKSIIVELCKSIGEILTFFELLRFKHRERAGYGKFLLHIKESK